MESMHCECVKSVKIERQRGGLVGRMDLDIRFLCYTAQMDLDILCLCYIAQMDDVFYVLAHFINGLSFCLE